jgi:hypothetical protein
MAKTKPKEQEKTNDLKHLDFKATEFMAMGKKYFVKQSLSVERFRWFEKYQVDFGFGRSYKSISDALKKAIEFGNKGKGIEAWNIVLNLVLAIGEGLEKRTNNAMMICALFIVTEDEDLTKWDEQMQLAKINDWNDEGYDVNSFFQLAANLVTGFIEDLEDILSNTSELAKALEMIKELDGTTQNA